MKFSLWFYACKLGVLLFPLAGLGWAFGEKNRVLDLIGTSSLIGLLLLCGIGGVFGILLALDKLKMRCPFCKRYGSVGGSRSEGLWMECDACGYIQGTGPLRLKLAAERPDDNPDPDDP